MISQSNCRWLNKRLSVLGQAMICSTGPETKWEHFGLPTDEYVLMQLRDLDWAAHAWDWIRRDP
jgi:thiamine biosynthesis protein ThiC